MNEVVHNPSLSHNKTEYLTSLVTRAIAISVDALALHEPMPLKELQEVFDVLYSQQTLSSKEYAYLSRLIDTQPNNPLVTKDLMHELLRLENSLLNHSLQYDPLTKLSNRQLFDNYLHQVSKNKTESSLALLDIDNFKGTNDTHGHLSGDILLKEFSNILRTHTPDDAFVSRWGGDEFAIIFPSFGIEDAHAKMKEIIQVIKETTFYTSENFAYSIASSAGVAPIESDVEVKKIIEKADELLYEAKERGKGIVLSPQDMLDQS